MKINIPFNDLLAFIRQLTPAQKQKVRKELDAESVISKNSDLRELLLNGPTLSDKQIKAMVDAHKSINEWRTK